MNKVYLLHSPSFPAHAKIGVSTDPKLRARQIESTIYEETGHRPTINVVFYIPLFFAYGMEGFLHTILRPLNKKGMVGSGKTEWFRIINPLTALGAFLIYYLFVSPHTPFLPFIGMVFVPIPLDFIILVAVSGAAQWAITLFITFKIATTIIYEKSKTNIAPTIQGVRAKENPERPTGETKPSTGRDI